MKGTEQAHSALGGIGFLPSVQASCFRAQTGPSCFSGVRPLGRLLLGERGVDHNRLVLQQAPLPARAPVNETESPSDRQRAGLRLRPPTSLTRRDSAHVLSRTLRDEP